MYQVALILAVAVLFVARLTVAGEVVYPIHSENTQVEWTGKKTNGKHDGGFKKVVGVAKIVDREGMNLEIEMDCRSIYSDNFLLTQHLKSGDFFAVKKFPKATFKSTRIEQLANDNFRVIGDLTFLDKTLRIEFPATIEAGDSLMLKAVFNINRRDFGMEYGPGKIDDLVEVRVVVKALRAAR